jgi:hypothetical protein
VRVDDATYSFLGDSPVANLTVTLTDTEITPTQTQFTAEAGGMEFTLTFLNPIEVRFIRVICCFNINLYFISARRLGQTVYSILIHVLNCELAGRRSSYSTGLL